MNKHSGHKPTRETPKHVPYHIEKKTYLGYTHYEVTTSDDDDSEAKDFGFDLLAALKYRNECLKNPEIKKPRLWKACVLREEL